VDRSPQARLVRVRRPAPGGDGFDFCTAEFEDTCEGDA
jgi:hypothetical protein